MEKREYKIEGMYCPACVKHVGKAISKVKGVTSSEVSLLSSSLTVFYSGSLNDEDIEKALSLAGYKGTPYSEITYKKERDLRSKGRVRSLIIMGVSLFLILACMYFSMGIMWHWPSFPPLWVNLLIAMVLSLAVMALHYRTYIRGLSALFLLHPSMESLIAIGSLASLAFGVYSFSLTVYYSSVGNMDLAMASAMNSYFDGAAMIPFFLSIGDFLLEEARTKATSSLEELLSLAPSSTKRKNEKGEEEEVLVSDIKAGDLITLRSGDKVPSDSTIISGNGNFSESSLTGEALPVYKKEGEKIYAGTMLIGGKVDARVLSGSNESYLSQVISLLKGIEKKRSKMGLEADKLATWFTPILIGISLLVFIVWYAVSKDLQLSITFALSVLVVSCPCALGLAVPLSVSVSSSFASKHGVLFKDEESLLLLGKANAFVFDKTGTLSEPYFTVSLFHSSNDQARDIFFSLEKGSSHPLAEASCLYLSSLGAQEKKIDSFKDIPGSGVEGDYEGTHYVLGSKKYLETLGCQVPAIDRVGSVSYLYDGKEVIAYIVLEAKMKEGVKETMEELRRKGCKTFLLSGDNLASTAAFGKEAGIDESIGEASPLDKEKIIERLEEEGYRVAFVGDGVNDAPSLKKSSVSLSVGGGTDLALSSASIILQNGTMESLLFAYRLSHKAERNIKGNLFYAFVYNLLAIPVAAGAFHYLGFDLSPAIASLLMALSSICVVLNSLAIQIERKKRIQR